MSRRVRLRSSGARHRVPETAACGGKAVFGASEGRREERDAKHGKTRQRDAIVVWGVRGAVAGREQMCSRAGIGVFLDNREAEICSFWLSYFFFLQHLSFFSVFPSFPGSSLTLYARGASRYVCSASAKTPSAIPPFRLSQLSPLSGLSQGRSPSSPGSFIARRSSFSPASSVRPVSGVSPRPRIPSAWRFS